MENTALTDLYSLIDNVLQNPEFQRYIEYQLFHSLHATGGAPTSPTASQDVEMSAASQDVRISHVSPDEEMSPSYQQATEDDIEQAASALVNYDWNLEDLISHTSSTLRPLSAADCVLLPAPSSATSVASNHQLSKQQQEASLEKLADFLHFIHQKKNLCSVQTYWNAFLDRFANEREHFKPMQIEVFKLNYDKGHARTKFKHLKLWILVLFAHLSGSKIEKDEKMNHVQITFETETVDEFFKEHHKNLFNMRQNKTHWIVEFVTNNRNFSPLVRAEKKGWQPTVRLYLKTST